MNTNCKRIQVEDRLDEIKVLKMNPDALTAEGLRRLDKESITLTYEALRLKFKVFMEAHPHLTVPAARAEYIKMGGILA